MATCQVSPFQEPASAVPGNIGIVRGKILVWDHDPMLGRAHQQFTFPFSQQSAQQLREEVRNAKFQLNSLFLEPVHQIQDVWLATVKPTGATSPAGDGSSDEVGVYALDLLLDPAAKDRLPGGIDYAKTGSDADLIGKDIFPHQIWLHLGSLLKKGPPLHPSEYGIDLAELKNAQNLAQFTEDEVDCSEKFQKFTLAELQSAPKWKYYEDTEGETGTKAFWPSMVTKQVPGSTEPVHWTLEKLTPVWQGTDFFVTIRKGDQKTDAALDNGPGTDCVDSNWSEYKYLIYNPKTPPSADQPRVGPNGTLSDGWIEGISNEAFYIPPKDVSDDQSTNNEDERFEEARKAFWWRFKTYVLIEIGTGHPDHNYFIELVKGRFPRLLHLGQEWDNTKRLVNGVIALAEDWKFVRKCRVLSEYKNISCDELFRKDEFRVSVRNHLGRLVVTFQGLENNPWVITRLDNDPSRFDFTKALIPMVVPPTTMRIHGGNLSATVGFGITRYKERAEVPFYDRQVDSFEDENETIDESLYMTFAQVGTSIKHENNRYKRQFFKDKRFRIRKIGYVLDAYETKEIHKNVADVTIPVYEISSKQWRRYGKGWLGPQRVSNPLNTNTGQPNGTFSTGLSTSSGGIPHRARITNRRNPGRPFVFGLSEEADSGYPYKQYASRWDVGVMLTAGSVMVPVPVLEGIDPGPVDFDIKAKLFKQMVTPIVPDWTLLVLGGAKPFEGKVDAFDIAPLTVSMSDSWTAEGFTTINHEMNIRCYIPDSMLPVSGDPAAINGLAVDQNVNLHALGQKLLTLHKQSFYLTVSYWWANGVGERDAPGNIFTRRSAPEDSELLIQMTGIAYGGSLEKSVNKLYMDFTVKDYTSILDKQFIFNSPFFDGVNDSVAVYELARMAGFDDNTNESFGIDRRPLGFLQKVISDRRLSQCENFRYNGEESIYRSYDLPGSFADLANPSVRFQNGETFLSAMVKIAQLATKVLYFDRWGVLRFENSPAIEAAFQSGDNPEDKFKPKFDFVTSPFPLNFGDDQTQNSSRFRFDPNQHVSHLVWNVVKYSRSVEDCINQIVLFTASNDIVLDDGSRTGGFIIEGYTFFDQIFNPSAEGFFGFRKPFYQSNGIFGGLNGVRLGIQHYAKMKFPPASISFQTYGVPGLKALDIITLDGNLFYITEIAHEIDPSTNNWWMNITGEWLKPFLGDLGFLVDKGTTDSGDDGDGN